MDRRHRFEFVLLVALMGSGMACGQGGLATGNDDGGADGVMQRGGGGASGDGDAATMNGVDGSDTATSACVPGGACLANETCTTPTACPGGRQRACFCDPNGVFACETCATPDGGGGGADSRADAVPTRACPANVMTGTTCTDQGTLCTATCAGGQTQTCLCTRTPRSDGGPTTWDCLRMCTVP